ncbi:MAG TPA: prephenate dehydrogenase [Nitriliruptorales bacterium]
MTDAGPPPFDSVLVIGCGLIGGSFALATQRLTGVRHVIVHDRDPEVRARAAALGVGTAVADDPSRVLPDVDLVVLATPVPTILGLVQEMVGRVRTHQILTDVASVKSRLVPRIDQLLGNSARYIGGHPMAGSERSGIGAADGTLFQGATWLLTPTAEADPQAFERLSSHLHALGTRVLAVDPDRHDRLVAAASHLPQVLASALMVHASRRAEQEAALFAVAAGGFRDVTRVAASDPALWRAILQENRVAVLAELDGYLDELGGLRDAIAGGDWDGVTRVLAAARDARRDLAGKDVDGTLHDLVIALPDSPGALAAVTTALGETGTNIEDLSMRHADDGTRGALVIAIAGWDRAQRARETLAERGFPSHLEAR